MYLTWADLPLVSDSMASVSAVRAKEVDGCDVCGSLILTSLLPKRLNESSRSSWSLLLARPTGPDGRWYIPSTSVSEVPLPLGKLSLLKDCEEIDILHIL